MKDKIEKEVAEKAAGGRLTCAAARKIADDLNVPYKSVGDAADKLKIKITNCQLGCF